MTIPKHTKKAAAILAGAREVRCYSLSNSFSGAPLAESPVVWSDVIDNTATPGVQARRELVHLTQQEFLRRELNQVRTTKLTTSGALFIIQVHSNLWYEFKSTEVRP